MIWRLFKRATKDTPATLTFLYHTRYGNAIIVDKADKHLWQAFDSQVRAILPMLRRRGKLIYRQPPTEPIFDSSPYTYVVERGLPQVMGNVLAALAKPDGTDEWHLAPLASVARVEMTVFEAPAEVPPYAIIKVRPLRLCFLLPYPIPPARVTLDLASSVVPPFQPTSMALPDIDLESISATLRRVQMQRVHSDAANVGYQILLYWLLVGGRKSLLEQSDIATVVQQTLTRSDDIDEAVRQLVSWLMIDKLTNLPRGLAIIRRYANDITTIITAATIMR